MSFFLSCVEFREERGNTTKYMERDNGKEG